MNYKKTLQLAEENFGSILCESHPILYKDMQKAISDNDESLKDEFVKYYNQILSSAKSYFDVASKKSLNLETNNKLVKFSEEINQLLISDLSKIDIKTLFANLTLVIENVVKNIAGSSEDSIKNIIIRYRNTRRKTYYKMKWKMLIQGMYSYRNIALEELFLGLMYYFKGSFKKEDLEEYERWHGFSKGGKVTKGEVNRLVESFSRQWEKIKFYKF